MSKIKGKERTMPVLAKLSLMSLGGLVALLYANEIAHPGFFEELKNAWNSQ